MTNLNKTNMELYETLTSAELTVVAECIKGAKAQDMAVVLGISENTVNSHKRKIFQKLHLQNTAQLVRFYHETEGFQELVQEKKRHANTLTGKITFQLEELEKIIKDASKKEITLEVTFKVVK